MLWTLVDDLAGVDDPTPSSRRSSAIAGRALARDAGG